ncbi:ABC transporter permease (plasmid) [Mesorhizobium sp. AR07]|uniref:ABC transporter permease n=1 Tax=Mesorhizobium sp. AR07 TaxID=2865838 RepID=UPI00215DE363|nr:ABC transporter permease [Mesorhizobium sp. AR07]UVK49012.1 ABC transporter permease [Mesorhizobium sp. AR07]
MASQILLLLPATAVFLVFLALPMMAVVGESFLTFVPGRIGALKGGPLTFQNYADLLDPAYIRYFAQTYFLAFCASIIAVLIGFPIAHHIVRGASAMTRKIWLFALIGLMFLSALVRVYAIQLTFGTVGILAPILSFLAIDTNGYIYVNVVIIAGILHYEIPMCILILIGAVLNVNPRLTEAAQSLGASAYKAHLTITVPLCAKGLASAFLVSMTVGVAAFAIPLILGRGRILFVSNLIYSRFSEVADSPSGAAIAVVMTVLSFALIFGLSRLTTLLDRT